MQKAKVVHVTTVHTPLDNRIFHKECRSLAEAGYEVVLIAPIDQDRQIDGVQLRAIARPDRRAERMLVSPWRALGQALAERADLYHLHDPELLPIAPVLAATGAAVVYDMHENVPKALATKPYLPAGLKRLAPAAFRAFERPVVGRLPVVFAEQSYGQDYPWVKRHATVLNYPRSEALWAIDEPPAERPTVGFIGDVSPARGSLVTIEALAELKRGGLAVDFECVGPTRAGHLNELQVLVTREGLDGVRFHGYKLPQEGYGLVARAHVGLAVLAPIPNNVDCCSTKIFEYMALGLPVIASDFRTNRAVIEAVGCGCVVDPEDPAALARALRTLLEDPARAREMGRRGREATRDRYNWATEAARLVAFYEELLPATRRAV